MQNTNNQLHSHNQTMNSLPSQQEINAQISQAQRAQSAFLQHLVGSAFATLDKLFHQASPATGVFSSRHRRV